MAKEPDRQFGKSDGATVERVEQLDHRLYVASNGRRLLSAAIDVFLLALLLGAEWLLLIILAVLTGEIETGMSRHSFTAWVWVGICWFLLLVCISVETEDGVTIGKKITRCVTRLRGGAAAGRGILCARSAIKYVPLIAFWVLVVPLEIRRGTRGSLPYGTYTLAGLCVLAGATFAGWCVCLFAPTHRALHDRLTGTAVFRCTPMNEPRGFEVWPTNANSPNVAAARMVDEPVEEE
ncbi:MAG: RDD family protein [Tepidisphaeraceae bacterium]|jgi:uncharacterized RDD family membrane protein YckC